MLLFVAPASIGRAPRFASERAVCQRSRRVSRCGTTIVAARRARIDQSDEAFVTCVGCGSDQIVSAQSLVREGSSNVQCRECGAKWTAYAVDAMTITGAKLSGGAAGGAAGSEKELAAVKGIKLWVGGLAPKVDSESLRSEMEEFGEVRDASVVYDRNTGRSRGFGFVTIVGESAASAAIDMLSGDSMSRLGRRLTVREAQDK